MFSVFKQYYMYFYTLFHLLVYKKNTNNITQTFLSNKPQIILFYLVVIIGGLVQNMILNIIFIRNKIHSHWNSLIICNFYLKVIYVIFKYEINISHLVRWFYLMLSISFWYLFRFIYWNRIFWYRTILAYCFGNTANIYL